MPENNLPENKIEDLKGLENNPETPSAPETGFESSFESAVESMDAATNRKSIDYLQKAVKKRVGNTQNLEISTNAERQKQIENFLSDGLEDAFLAMDAKGQAEFKRKGEETANKINQLLDKAKINTKKIVDLIKKWLMMIPGVNKIFLEQSAKIKADKIINLRKEQDGQI